jgi:hypothetical protein
MESTTLASAGDAELILRLYELRRETTMRAARHWMAVDFDPKSGQDIVAILKDFGSQENQYLRQVHSYWEMAASFVLRGALDPELFVDCSGENLFLLAKFYPFLEEIRTYSSDFFIRTEQIALKHSGARTTLERLIKVHEGRRTAATSI